MSDLQCAARVFVARHGEAEYETDLLHDLGGSLTSRGREQSRLLAASLVDERIARIWSSPMSRAVQTAEIVAARLGVDVVVREGLRELLVGEHAGSPVDPDPFADTFGCWLAGDLEARIAGGETGGEVMARVVAVLDEVADLHRGEAALVIGHGGAMCTAIPSVARNLGSDFPRGRPLANGGVVHLAADVDGWIARSWGGEDLPVRENRQKI